jgi:hypothetical protein
MTDVAKTLKRVFNRSVNTGSVVRRAGCAIDSFVPSRLLEAKNQRNTRTHGSPSANRSRVNMPSELRAF